MNKKELAQELGFSVQTISRYVDMGLPFQKDGGKRVFDLTEAEQWINDNIDRREPERPEKMTAKQATAWAFETLERWRPYVDFEKMLKDGIHMLS